MAEELCQQEEIERDEEPSLKCMNTSNVQGILSAMGILTESSVQLTTTGSEV
jgi:hypothetical protein